MQEVVTVTSDWAIIFEHKTIETFQFMGDVAVDDVKISLVPGTAVKLLVSLNVIAIVCRLELFQL